eukprot:536003_1
MSLFLFWIIICKITRSQLCNQKQYVYEIGQKLKNSLGDKYTITQGKLAWPSNFTSWGNNPSGVYGVYVIPKTQITVQDGIYDTLLHSHDAIVFAGCTPPVAKYFSIIPYLYNRFNAKNIINKNTNATKTLAEFRTCAALGAGINHLIINTSSQNPFDSLTTVIETADNDTYSDIYSVLHNESRPNDINLLRIPNDYFVHAPYNVDIHTYPTYPLIFDSYYTIWRIEIPLNNTAFYQYINNYPGNSQTVFYLKYNNAEPDDITPFQKYNNLSCTRDCKSSSSINETTLFLDNFMVYVHDLAVNVSSFYKYSIINITQMYEWGSVPNYGYQGITESLDAGCNNPDAVYFVDHPLTITDTDYYMVVGINSFKQNLTTYQSLCYMVRDGNPFEYGGYALRDAVFNNFQYYNSTYQLNVATNVSEEVIQNFYVIQAGRPNSFIPGIMGFNITYKDVNSTCNISFVERNYLHPLTKTQPDLLDLVTPMIIQFKRS